MFRTLTKKESQRDEKELIKFCKDNHCMMFNLMRAIQSYSKAEVNKDLQKAYELALKQIKRYKKLLDKK